MVRFLNERARREQLPNLRARGLELFTTFTKAGAARD
jgi:hypothetical protein